jgi:hypothetical protein
MALFPDYIYTRFAGYAEEPIAAEVGVSVDAITLNSLGSVPYAPQIAEEGFVSVARYRWRIPYVARDPWTPVWNELVAAGFAVEARDGWSLTVGGFSLCDELHRRARRYLESLDLAQPDLSWLSLELSMLVGEIPPYAERAMCAHRGLPLQNEIQTDVLRVDRAISELWNFRDDSHIGAWQAAGYSGPRLDLLSQVWEGTNSVEEVLSVLEGRQERNDVEREIGVLIASGDMERNAEVLALTSRGRDRRESIEQETDIRFFRGWPDGDDLARLGDNLALLVGSLS